MKQIDKNWNRDGFPLVDVNIKFSFDNGLEINETERTVSVRPQVGPCAGCDFNMGGSSCNSENIYEVGGMPDVMFMSKLDWPMTTFFYCLPENLEAVKAIVTYEIERRVKLRIEEAEEHIGKWKNQLVGLISSRVHSKLRKTVYHISNEKFKVFRKDFSPQGVHWFSSEREDLIKNKRGAAIRASAPMYLYTCEINFSQVCGRDEYEKRGLGELRQEGYQAIALEGDYVVFNEDDINIKKVEEV